MRVALTIIACVTIACQSSEGSSSLGARLERLKRVDQLTENIQYSVKTVVLNAAYRDLFASMYEGDTLRTLDAQDLDHLYNAAYIAAFYTFDTRYVHDMELVMARLGGRGLADKGYAAQLYEMLVKTRMLDEARAFAKDHPQVAPPTIPPVREAAPLPSDRPTELAMDAHTHELVRRSVDVHLPAQVIAVTSPTCHFSKDAMQAIEQDPALDSLLGAHTTWLAPQDAPLDVNLFATWNLAHPGKAATWAFRRDEWPMIDAWGTPTFYFLQNGHVRAKVTGWPKEGRRAELLAAAKQVGLLD